MNTNAIIMIYHSFFHVVMTYEIIFCGNSSTVFEYLEWGEKEN